MTLEWAVHRQVRKQCCLQCGVDSTTGSSVLCFSGTRSGRAQMVSCDYDFSSSPSASLPSGVCVCVCVCVCVMVFTCGVSRSRGAC
jgi:hypothetical protein